MDGPFVPSWRKDDENIVIKPKNDDYDSLKKNSGVLYILQCTISDEIFNHVCSCETAKGLREKLILIYEETSEQIPDSVRRANMFCNLNYENGITHFCLMANKGVVNQDASDNDDHDDACTSG